MNSYYQDLYDTDIAHVQAGWRHPLEQRLRFIVACELPQCAPQGTLLDLGCGPGELVPHLREVDWFGQDATCESHYLGVDTIEQAVALARQRQPGARFERATSTARADTVMAIGAMISGEPCSRARRLGRIKAFIAHCVESSDVQGVVVMLDQGALDAQPSLGLEDALFGVYRGEELDGVVTWMRGAFEVHVSVRPPSLSADVVLYWSKAQRLELEHASADELCERACEMSVEEVSPYWRAWLYFQVGRRDRAREALSGESLCERGRLLMERLDYA